MATGLAVGGDVERALDSVGVPSYVLDTTGVVRWINPAAERLLGDVRGRHFTSVVAPEDSLRARELFARKVLGKSPTDATGHLVSTDGRRVAVEVSSVPLIAVNGRRVRRTCRGGPATIHLARCVRADFTRGRSQVRSLPGPFRTA
jgi:PAS domain S-box-containing protein